MSQQVINVGAAPNDGAGDRLRPAFEKVNANFTETYALAGAAQSSASVALIAAAAAQSDADDALAGLALKEDLANKSTNGALGASDTLYPSQKAVKTYTDTGLALKEALANKSTNTALGASDTLYPTQNAVKSYVDTGLALKEVLTNKSTDGTMAANSATLYPSQSAVRTYVAANATSFPAEFYNTDGSAMEFFDEYGAGAISTFDKGFGWANNGVGTGTTIVSRTPADGRAHKRLELKSGQYGRKMPWGALWNRVKIVLLWRINNGSSISNIECYAGICSGTTNMVASGTTDNFVGVRLGDGSGTATFTAGTKANMFNVPTVLGQTRRGTTSTSRSGGSSGHTITSTEGYLAVQVVEVYRPVFATDGTGVNYQVGEASTSQVNAQYSIPKNAVHKMLDSVASGTTSLVQGSNEATIAGGNAAITAPFSFDQSTGVLDTLNISWGHSQGLELAAIGVRKVF